MFLFHSRIFKIWEQSRYNLPEDVCDIGDCSDKFSCVVCASVVEDNNVEIVVSKDSSFEDGSSVLDNS